MDAEDCKALIQEYLNSGQRLPEDCYHSGAVCTLELEESIHSDNESEDEGVPSYVNQNDEEEIDFDQLAARISAYMQDTNKRRFVESEEEPKDPKPEAPKIVRHRVAKKNPEASFKQMMNAYGG